MLKQSTYIAYLESLVLSLIAERPDPGAGIVIVDEETLPSLRDASCNPHLVKEQINDQRRSRLSFDV